MREMPDTEWYLRALLHYHERALDGMNVLHCGGAKTEDGKCPATYMLDAWGEALREAIRCVAIVHEGEKEPVPDNGKTQN